MDFSLSFTSLEAISPLLAAGGLNPDEIPGLGWFTNSLFVAIFVTVAILLFTRMATRRMEMVPGKKQNLVEFVVEFLYGQVEAVVGEKVAPKVFPLLCTIFVFVLICNWSGLLPGVGTAGIAYDEGEMAAPLTIKAEGKMTPILRPPSADLNFTLALAAVFMIVWAWVTIREVGVMGFIDHTFGVKGGVEGLIKWLLVPIFILVGVIELISIASRPVSLSLRLFGNVYAGETLLASMMALGKSLGLTGIWAFISSVLLPLPFYFLEILVGILQATVFSLLCAIFVKLSTTHDEAH